MGRKRRRSGFASPKQEVVMVQGAESSDVSTSTPKVSADDHNYSIYPSQQVLSVLVRHTYNVSPEHKKELYTCSYCRKQYSTRSWYIKHIKYLCEVKKKAEPQKPDSEEGASPLPRLRVRKQAHMKPEEDPVQSHSPEASEGEDSESESEDSESESEDSVDSEDTDGEVIVGKCSKDKPSDGVSVSTETSDLWDTKKDSKPDVASVDVAAGHFMCSLCGKLYRYELCYERHMRHCGQPQAKNLKIEDSPRLRVRKQEDLKPEEGPVQSHSSEVKKSEDKKGERSLTVSSSAKAQAGDSWHRGVTDTDSKRNASPGNSKRNASPGKSKPNASPGNSEPNASSGNSKRNASPGNKPNASFGNNKRNASSSNSKPNASSGNSKHNVSPGNSEPNVSSGNSKPNVSSGNSKPNASPGNSKPNVSSGNSKRNASPGNSKRNASPGNSEPNVSSGNSKPNVSSGNSKPNASPGNSEPNASPGNSEPNVSSGKSKRNASSGNSEPNVSSGNSKPNVSSGNSKPNASPGNSEPNASSGKSKRNASSGNSEPNASSGNSKRNASSGNSEPNVSSGNSKPNVSSGNSKPNASPGNSKPNASPGNSKRNASSGKSKPNVSSGNSKPNASSGNSEPNASSGNSEPNASSGNSEPNVVSVDVVTGRFLCSACGKQYRYESCYEKHIRHCAQPQTKKLKIELKAPPLDGDGNAKSPPSSFNHLRDASPEPGVASTGPSLEGSDPALPVQQLVKDSIPTDQLVYSCSVPYCGQSFIDERALLDHQGEHSGLKDGEIKKRSVMSVCGEQPVCGTRYSQASAKSPEPSHTDCLSMIQISNVTSLVTSRDEFLRMTEEVSVSVGEGREPAGGDPPSVLGGKVAAACPDKLNWEMWVQRFVRNHARPREKRLNLDRSCVAAYKGGRRVVCLLCGRRFRHNKALDQHVASAHCERLRYPCASCNMSYKARINLCRHTLQAHCDLKKLKCCVCKRRYRAAHHLQGHVLKQHCGQKNLSKPPLPQGGSSYSTP